MHIISSHFIIS